MLCSALSARRCFQREAGRHGESSGALPAESLSGAHRGDGRGMGCGSSRAELCREICVHLGPGAQATRSTRAQTGGETEEIGATGGCFKLANPSAKGDRNNLMLRRGRLPFGCDHSLNLSGHWSSNSSLAGLYFQILLPLMREKARRIVAPNRHLAGKDLDGLHRICDKGGSRRESVWSNCNRFFIAAGGQCLPPVRVWEYSSAMAPARG